MGDVKSWYSRLVIEKTAEALRANGFQVHVAWDRESAKETVLKLVPEGSTVGVGGSVTVRELGLVEELERRGFRVFHHWVDAPPEKVWELMRKELTSDVFITSSNAVTMDGKLVNIDNAGNRVAAMVFGPRRVIIVVGRNKIVKDVEEGLRRARNVAAVMNSKRLGRDNPCVKVGYCVDCRSPTRSCNVVMIVERRPSRTDVHVVLVDEDLGF